MRSFLKFRSKSFWLIIVLLLAGSFRLYGITWDQNHQFHPDERMIIMTAGRLSLPESLSFASLVTPESPLNPGFFAYGSLPIYLVKLTGSLLAFLTDQAAWAYYGKLHLIGRAYSGLFDLGTVILIFLLGRRIFQESVGLMAALLYGLSVLPIQLSHFYAVDVILAFFILLTLYLLVRLYEKPTLINAVSAGIAFGLALSTKVSASLLVIPLGFALLVDFYFLFLKVLQRDWIFRIYRWGKRVALVLRYGRLRLTPKFVKMYSFFKHWIVNRIIRQSLIPSAKLAAIVLVSSVVVFLMTEPYAFVDFDRFWSQIREQSQMTKSAFTFPYTLQYVGTLPYLYFIEQIVIWGLGPPLGLVVLLASVFSILFHLRRLHDPETKKFWIVSSFFVSYLLVVGRFAVKFMRYMLPIYPLLVLFGSFFLFWLFQRFGRRPFLFWGGVTLVLIVPTLLYALAFVSIYSEPNTRVQATVWINQNVPQGSKIAIEHWDDRVPLWGSYQFLEMPMYEPDDSSLKWELVESNLEQADYIVLASNRLYVPLQKLADCQKNPKRCYPKTALYYQTLFSGDLGFEKVAEFTSFPRLKVGSWKLEIDDSRADESFTVYDHPKVIIFEKGVL